MEENNIIEIFNDLELAYEKENNSKFCKIQRNLIIIGCLLLMSILFLYNFILIDVKSPQEFERSKDRQKFKDKKIFEEKALNNCEIGEEEKCLECDSSTNAVLNAILDIC